MQCILQPHSKILEQLGKKSLLINGVHLGLNLVFVPRLLLTMVLPEGLYDRLPPTAITTVYTIVICLIVMKVIVPIIDKKIPWLLNYEHLNKIIIEKTTRKQHI